MGLIPSSKYTNPEIQIPATVAIYELEDSYLSFIKAVIPLLDSNATFEDALPFFCLLSKGSHILYSPSSIWQLKDKFPNIEDDIAKFSHIGHANAASFTHTRGSVNLTTYLAAYVVYASLLEKYNADLEDKTCIDKVTKYLFEEHNRYLYNCGYVSAYNPAPTTVDFSQTLSPYNVKTIRANFVEGIKSKFFGFEKFALSYIDEGRKQSVNFGSINNKTDFLKKIFNVGMFTYNIGKVGYSALERSNYSNTTTTLFKFLANDSSLLEFFLEKIFLYPSPSFTGAYKSIFMFDGSGGLFTEDKIDAIKFCLYLKTKGHPVNTKTARLIASFAGVFDDPLAFDFYLTKFLYTQRENSRGKQLVDEIKFTIDACERKNKEIEKEKQRVINEKIGVFEHLVTLGREIRSRIALEPMFFSKNRLDFYRDKFSRGDKEDK